MVQEDAHVAVSILLVAKGVLYFGLASIRTAGEIVVAHGDGRVAVHLNLVVVEHNVSPALATVDGEACVLLMTVLHGLVPNKVRHGVGGCRSELGFCCLPCPGWCSRWHAFFGGSTLASICVWMWRNACNSFGTHETHYMCLGGEVRFTAGSSRRACRPNTQDAQGVLESCCMLHNWMHARPPLL